MGHFGGLANFAPEDRSKFGSVGIDRSLTQKFVARGAVA